MSGNGIHSVSPNMLHHELYVKEGGSSFEMVEQKLQKIDEDKDGMITWKDILSFHKWGKEGGFYNEDARWFFRAGIDAAALASIKGLERMRGLGPQFSLNYIEKNMKPFLTKTYTTYFVNKAVDIVVQQATREWTKDTMEDFEKKTPTIYDTLQSIAIGLVLGAKLIDTNKNSRIDADDQMYVAHSEGGYTSSPIGKEKADRINEITGLLRGKNFLNAGLKFPNDSDSEPAWIHHDKTIIGNKEIPKQEWMGNTGNIAWKLLPAQEFDTGRKTDDGRKIIQNIYEFQLDTNVKAPSQALDDMIKNAGNYCFDCAMAKQVIQFMRVREVWGNEKFNQMAIAHGMKIGYSFAIYKPFGGLFNSMTKQLNETPSMPETYKLGWQGYAKVSVKKEDVLKKYPKIMVLLEGMGWSGEHFTIGVNELNENVVFAHPLYNSVPIKNFDNSLRDTIISNLGENKPAVTIARADITIEYTTPFATDINFGS